jgi:hypothetical protein
VNTPAFFSATSSLSTLGSAMVSYSTVTANVPITGKEFHQ